VLDLDPRYISPVDSLSLLPYRIEYCGFDQAENDRLVFIVDSLGNSYSVGTYDLFSRKVTTVPLPFRGTRVCASGDTLFVSEEVADSTVLWEIAHGTPARRLFSWQGNIYDITLMDNALLVSSDFGRGLFDPTIYRYNP